MGIFVQWAKSHFKDPGPGVIQALTRWKGAMINDMARYPTQRPHIRYRRTGNYGRNWRYRIQRDEAIVFNKVGYAEFLAGDSPGTAARWARAYGWPALRDVAKRHQGPLEKELGKKLRGAIRFTKI